MVIFQHHIMHICISSLPSEWTKYGSRGCWLGHIPKLGLLFMLDNSSTQVLYFCIIRFVWLENLVRIDTRNIIILFSSQRKWNMIILSCHLVVISCPLIISIWMIGHLQIASYILRWLQSRVPLHLSNANEFIFSYFTLEHYY